MGLFFRILTVVSFTLMLTVPAVAQEELHCATPSELSTWTEEYLSKRNAFPKNNNLLYVPLSVFIVGTDAGEGYISVQSVLNALCVLNQDFAPGNVQFYIQGDIRYINRSAYYEHSSLNVGFNMQNEFRPINTIGFFIVSDAAGAAGYATGIGGNSVVVRKSEMSIGNRTLAHEIGHVLGLYHTFFGWEGTAYDRNNTTPIRVSNRLVELVDGSNCQAAGDGFCDTSPDYLSERWDCNNEGRSTIELRDPQGASFRSDGTNIMSYASDRCVNRFSNEQLQAMRAHLQGPKFTFLNRAQPAPDINTLTSAPIFPGSGETVDVNAVYIEWEPVPGASDYILEVSRLGSFPGALTEVYHTKTASITVSNLQENRTYHWRVRAYNRNSFCANPGPTRTFRTAVMTAVNDLDRKLALNVFPNPVGSDQPLTIQVNAASSADLVVRLQDISGRLIRSENYRVAPGESTLQFNPGSAAAGLYLLNFTSDGGSTVRRVVIR